MTSGPVAARGDRRLTGRIQLKPTLMGGVTVEVEEVVQIGSMLDGKFTPHSEKHIWRKLKSSDLTVPILATMPTASMPPPSDDGREPPA